MQSIPKNGLVIHCVCILYQSCTVHVNWMVMKMWSLSSVGLDQALVRSGWMMFGVLGVKHVFSPAQTGELGLTIATIPKMWQFSVLVLAPLAETAPLLIQLRLQLRLQLPPLYLVCNCSQSEGVALFYFGTHTIISTECTFIDTTTTSPASPTITHMCLWSFWKCGDFSSDIYLYH